MKSLHILLCDDDDDDRYLFQKALKKHDPSARLSLVCDGEELMETLKKARDLPDIIFLDLNMPRKNGFECLEEIKKNVLLKNIPVIIMSTTCQEEAILKAYEAGANLFITKPVTFPELEVLIERGITTVTRSKAERTPRNKFLLKLS